LDPKQYKENNMAGNSTLKNQDDIVQHLERLRADFVTLSETVTRLASESAASAQSQVRDSANRAVRGASAAGSQIYKDTVTIGQDAMNTASAATGQLEKEIARNPMTAVLAALGVGFAIGLLSHRR
jgi:ElaB/YqjD/DUF883 family membrane-anchored ribosome-binding protein